MRTHWKRSARWLAAVALGGSIYYCPAGTEVAAPPARPAGRAAGQLLYRAARPILEPTPPATLYISGYAGRRPAPRPRRLLRQRPAWLVPVAPSPGSELKP